MHRQTPSMAATSSHGGRTVGPSARLWTIVRPMNRLLRRSRLTPKSPVMPTSGRAKGASRRSSQSGVIISVSLCRKQTNSVSASGQPRLKEAMTESLRSLKT